MDMANDSIMVTPSCSSWLAPSPSPGSPKPKGRPSGSNITLSSMAAADLVRMSLVMAP